MSLPEYSIPTEKQSSDDHKVSYLDEKDPKVFASPATLSSPVVFNGTPFLEPFKMRPGTTLYISARGIGLLRFPLPSSELEIPVFRNDGSLAYTSVREKRCSGNAILSHPALGILVSTTYSCGPRRAPVLKLLHGSNASDSDERSIKVYTKWTSRSVWFEDAEGRVFGWRYERTKDAAGKKVNILALEQQEDSKPGREESGKTIAVLVRGDDRRTPGSRRSSAGNGGQLTLDQEATRHLDEALIVATCLMMLKRELDRRRCGQTAVIVAVAAGAS